MYTHAHTCMHTHAHTHPHTHTQTNKNPGLGGPPGTGPEFNHRLYYREYIIYGLTTAKCSSADRQFTNEDITVTLNHHCVVSAFQCNLYKTGCTMNHVCKCHDTMMITTFHACICIYHIFGFITII